MAMKKPAPGHILVDEIPDCGLDWTFEVPADVLKGLLPMQFLPGAVPLSVEAHLTRSESNVIASGRVSGILRSVCGRCLAENDYAVRKQFRHVFIEGEDPARDKAEETIGENDDLDCSFFSGDEIDVLSVAGDEMVLSLPLNPLCSTGCRGLCPTCGVDRNVEKCGCGTDVVDPRWAKLKDLKIGPKP